MIKTINTINNRGMCLFYGVWQSSFLLSAFWNVNQDRPRSWMSAKEVDLGSDVMQSAR